MNKSKHKSMSIMREVFDMAKQMADKDGRSVANFIRLLVYQEFGRRNK